MEIRWADFVAVQDTHLTVERSHEMSARLAKLGWHAHEAPAEGSGSGFPGHGGLLLMAQRVHGMEQFEGVGRSIIDDGRATFVHQSGSGGMVL
eukprot:9139636-Pyramimonas_sp.AAC.1